MEDTLSQILGASNMTNLLLAAILITIIFIKR